MTNSIRLLILLNLFSNLSFCAEIIDKDEIKKLFEALKQSIEAFGQNDNPTDDEIKQFFDNITDLQKLKECAEKNGFEDLEMEITDFICPFKDYAKVVKADKLTENLIDLSKDTQKYF